MGAMRRISRPGVEKTGAYRFAYYVTIVSLSKDNLPPFSSGTLFARHHLTVGFVVGQVIWENRDELIVCSISAL